MVGGRREGQTYRGICCPFLPVFDRFGHRCVFIYLFIFEIEEKTLTLLVCLQNSGWPCKERRSGEGGGGGGW